MFIYIIHCLINGKYYVGQHGGANLQKYLRQKFIAARRLPQAKNHLYRALRKYPFESFIIEPLVSDIKSFEQLDSLEMLWIAGLNARDDSVGMNIALGGTAHIRGMKASAETKKKLRDSHLGQPGYWTGKKFSEEFRKKLSEAHIRNPPPSPDLKWCNKEQKFVDLEEFHDSVKKKASGYCKKCMSEYARTRRAKSSSSPNNLPEIPVCAGRPSSPQKRFSDPTLGSSL